jgi:predicted GNAT family N-acyltransferase
VATIDDELAGLIVRKEETHAESKTKYAGPKILKVCTFKVKPKYRGEKLGELLLKQVLWFAQKNAFDLVYLTTFSDQTVLISVLLYYGFEKTGTNALGEEIYEKPLRRDRIDTASEDGLFDLARTNYPRFVGRTPAEAFCVPIRGEYHDVLFRNWLNEYKKICLALIIQVAKNGRPVTLFGKCICAGPPRAD